MIKRLLNYFTLVEKIIWLSSVIFIIACFCIFDRSNYFNLITSILGVTSLIFGAKANPISQVFGIGFCILYAVISVKYRYYGEMLTYLLMTLPMTVIAMISWFKNPYKGNKSEVTIGKISKKETIFMFIVATIITSIFYFILKYFNTANLIFSTISITTSFIAVYLTYKRSPFYAVGYACNDIVLIILWTLASIENISYISILACFVAFFVSDIYAFINWTNIQKKQNIKDTLDSK